MASAMNGEQLIGYCEIHCKTERALFSRQQVNAMIELAGFPEDYVSQIPPMISWVSLHEEMEELCRLARKRIADEKLELEAHGRFHRPTPPDQKQAVIIPFKMNVAAAQSDIIDALQNKGKQMNFHPFEDSEENRAAAEEKAAQDRNDEIACHNATVQQNKELKQEAFKRESVEKVRSALCHFYKTLSARADLWNEAATAEAVEKAKDSDLAALNKLREVFAEATKDVNTKEVAMSTNEFDIMRFVGMTEVEVQCLIKEGKRNEDDRKTLDSRFTFASAHTDIQQYFIESSKAAASMAIKFEELEAINERLKSENKELQLKIAELEKDVGRLASNNVSLRQEFCQPKLF